MDTRTDERLNDLEIKTSFLDDMLEELNKVVVRQQAQIDLLLREVGELKAARAEPQPGLSSADVAARARADMPPHY